MPGQQYFAGTHFNPNSTWWAESAAVPRLTSTAASSCCSKGCSWPTSATTTAITCRISRSSSGPIRRACCPATTTTSITEEAMLTRMSVQDGRLVLPDGMSYRVLVLPDRDDHFLPVLRKLKELVAAGATVIGPKPAEASGLKDYPQSDAEVARLAAELWGDCDGKDVKEHRFGKGRVFWGKSAREVLGADGMLPDFQVSGAKPEAAIDYIHRSVGGAEIYFVANRSNRSEEVRCTFRVAGKAPELWDAVTGERGFAAAYEQNGSGTTVPIEFAPCGSWFIIFREPASSHPATAKGNGLRLKTEARAS